MHRHSWIALPIVAALLLAGCTGEPAAAPEEPAPAETETRDAAPVEEPGDGPVPECRGITLEEGSVVSGADFAACVIGFSVAAGSGRQRVTSDTLTGTVEFVYGTSPQAHVLSEAPPAEIIVTDEGAWVRGDGGWDSGEIAQMMGQAWRAFAQPAVAFGMLAASDYTITAREQIENAQGIEVRTWRFRADDPIDMAGVTVESLEMWLSADLVPVRQESVSSLQGGFRGSMLNEYYDWGADISIELPATD